jgi:uncharacterized protein YerC
VIALVEAQRLSIPQMRAQARRFDQISEETGAHYSAVAFVEWLEREMRHGERAFPAGMPGRKRSDCPA